jgi:hypothetical protein
LQSNSQEKRLEIQGSLHKKKKSWLQAGSCKFSDVLLQVHQL